jgi:catechol 2,3-dioxygenase-like lactoylglutathione lyase family enzyme
MKVKKLILYSNNLNAQKHFYCDTLGIPINYEDTNEFSVKIGETELVFIQKDNEDRNYHFAINIPFNKVTEAYEWLKTKTRILPFDDNEIVDFKNWNAEAMYFYDKSRNIIELIARRNLGVVSNNKFDSRSFLNICEVGLPVFHSQATIEYLKINFDLPEYDCKSDVFCAIGDEEGMFIVIDSNEKKWIPNFDDAYPHEFIVEFENNGMDYNLNFSEH